MAINVRGEYDRLANQLENIYKDEIKKKGLVDTGKLYDSIRVITEESQGQFHFKIEAMDYFKYVDERYNITKDIFNSSRYRDWLDSVTDIQINIILDGL
jgi:hypothetical protein